MRRAPPTVWAAGVEAGGRGVSFVMVSGGVHALSIAGHMGGRQDLKGGLWLTVDSPVWRPSRVMVPGNRGRFLVTEGWAGACAQLYPPTCRLTAG
jgi:hypothetical protein